MRDFQQLIISRLFTTTIGGSESVVISGTERFSTGKYVEEESLTLQGLRRKVPVRGTL